MVNLLDDYHNIHVRKVPVDLQKNKVAHMASSMLDIHTTIPAVTRTTTSPHRPMFITLNGNQVSCLGGIDSDRVNIFINEALRQMCNHFVDQIPNEMKMIDPSNLQTFAQSFRYIKILFLLKK